MSGDPARRFDVRSERRESVQLLTLSRPDVMNALDTETLESPEARAGFIEPDIREIPRH